ncbi:MULTISPECIES: tetratricopeptide repeat protein [Sphingobacterium]|uniref:Tetratricopeptide repeat protein n=1 Tax=Sphingobacterium hotanense TaxID=649196 RepID=A0ABT7NIH2_9SPHI|nr:MULTISPECIES: tetratricopeptide repeat protein [Sphingobacterium]MDM1046982.1 tetratricopeptide repeat protein [Sphingobacterium hotanense]
MSQNKQNVSSTTTGGSKKSFFQENEKSIIFIVAGIIVLILLYIGYQKLYLAPRAEKAAAEMYQAEQYATIDSLQKKAIEGDGSFAGFKEIADEYSNTKSANIANAYLGGLYLRQKNFKEAIKYLEQYSETGSAILDPLVIGLLGDAYSEEKIYDKAANFYKKAAEKSSNTFTTPVFLKKLGLVYEELQDYKNAEATYEKIRNDFPESAEATTIDSFIARVQAKQ